jgi:hypothetical protein
MRRIQRLSRSGFCCLLAFTLSLGARAQTSAADKAAAEALFEQGLDAMRAGRTAEGCAKLEQSQSIERGIGTSLYLAECYEKLGRTASAWGLFREAASEAQARGEADRAAAGKRHAEKLEPLLSRLTLQVAQPDAIPGFEVLRDGTAVPRAVWNVAVPVDPGEHRIQARAPGYVEWSEVVKVEGNSASASVVVPVLVAAPPAATEAAVPAASALAAEHPPAPAPAPAPAESSHPGKVQRITGLVVAGAGVVALGFGGYFGIRAISKNDSATQYCPDGGSVCNSQEGVDLTHEAQDAARMANILVISGAVLTAGGLTLFFTAPSDHAPRVGFVTDGRSARLGIGGKF